MLKSNSKLILLVISCSFFIISCATTDTSSISDRFYHSGKFSKICVNVLNDDIEWKNEIENEMVESLNDAGINAIQGGYLFPPTRKWNNKKIEKVLKENNYDGYLVVIINEYGVYDRYLPPKYVTKSKKVKRDDSSDIYVEETYNEQIPGQVEREYFAKFTTKLIDVKSFEEVWIATSKSDIGGFYYFAKIRSVFESFGSDVIDKLEEDGYLR